MIINFTYKRELKYRCLFIVSLAAYLPSKYQLSTINNFFLVRD